MPRNLRLLEIHESNLKFFSEIPYILYRGDSFWVPPLKKEYLHLLGLGHPFWKHASRRLFAALDGGRACGCAAAIINANHNQFHNEKCGFFGFFESVNDREVSNLLLAACRSWLKSEGMEIMRGPMNPSTNETCGLLINGFDSPPAIMMPYNPAYYPVVVVPLISGQGIRICNERNTGYMDLTGNMKIAVGGIYVEKEGKPDYGREYSRPEQSIFSPKSSRISLCFLHGPQREFTRKDIMEKSGLSKGMVSRIVKLMTKTGYILEKANKLKLSNFNDLLSAWAESIINRRDIRRSYYVWAQSPRQLMRTVAESFSVAGIRYAFTQEAGASLVAPFSTFDIITAYIDSLNKFPAAELSATETSKGFNLVLIEPYDEVVLTSARSVLGMQVVDNLQLYADLKKNVLRGDKQAEHIRDIIGKELE